MSEIYSNDTVLERDRKSDSTARMHRGAKTEHILASVLFFISMMLHSAAISAEDWSRLADGRVVIEIFGERLAFDPKDGVVVEFREGLQKMFDLNEALSNPEAARRRIEEIDAESHVWIVLQNSFHWREKLNRRFLGKFDWAEVPTIGFPNYLSIYINRAGNPLYRRPTGSYPNEFYPFALGTTPNGFSIYPHRGIESVEPRKPSVTAYVLSGDRRIRASSDSHLVECRWGGPPTRSCTAQLISKDLRMRARWSWWESVFSEEKWRALDAKLQDIVGYIVLSRTGEDFQ